MKSKSKDIKFSLKNFWRDFLGRIWSIYFYLLFFYIIVRFLAYFFKPWQEYFDWKFFNFFIILFTILILFHPSVSALGKKNIIYFLKVKEKIYSLNFKKIKSSNLNLPKSYFTKLHLFSRWAVLIIRSGLDIFKEIMKWFFSSASLILKSAFKKVWFLARKYGYQSWRFLVAQFNKICWGKTLIAKLIFVVAAMTYFIFFKEISTVNLFILFYGLISILFIVDSRLSSGAGLLLLLWCPFLLSYNKVDLAQAMAVYAYYLLIISVITAAGECFWQKNFRE